MVFIVPCTSLWVISKLIKMCRLDGPDLQDIRLQNLHQYHFKPQESAGYAFLFLWNRPKKSAHMCDLSQCLVFETERLVLQISVNISRPFDVSCKPEVTHCQAPTPPGLPPSNNQNFSFQITLCTPPPCHLFSTTKKRILPSSSSLSSRLASLLSFLSWRSISALIRFCSCCSSERQHAITAAAIHSRGG